MSRRLQNPSIDVLIRPMGISDVRNVVAIHLLGFSGFFLTFLGSAFLREFYAATLTDTSCIGFVAENKGGVCGFVTGTDQPAGFYRRLLRTRWWRFALASIPPFLRRPAIVPRLLRAFSKPEEATHTAGRGTLMSIAVLPTVQNKGIGDALVNAFLQESANRGLNCIDLTTDRENNPTVNDFYHNLGFVCERTFTSPEGRTMNEYVIALKSDHSVPSRHRHDCGRQRGTE
jgi:ribosomal protein S18 acetylase RimI-like enzyme